MKSRLIASLIVGAAVVLGTTGCNMNTTMATQIPYSPSDGVAVPDSGPILVRNALFVADESGEDANFVAVLINSTDKTATLHLEIGEGSAKIEESIRVPADTTISLGVDEEPLLIEGLGVKPGATVPVYFQSADEAGALVDVPVLDGTLEYLSSLAP